METSKKIIPEGDSHAERTGILVVPFKGVKKCDFGISQGVQPQKVHSGEPSQKIGIPLGGKKSFPATPTKRDLGFP